MSEEKKNQPMGDEGKNRKQKPRKHGYFIQPAGEQSATEVKVNDTPATGSTPKQGKKHKHNRQGPGKQGAPAEKGAPTEKNAPAEVKPSPEKPVGGAQGNQNQHKKKNKNKNKHKPKPAAEQASKKENATQKAPSSAKNRPFMREVKPLMEHSADDYEEYKFGEDLETPQASQEPTPKADVPKTEVVGIRFKSTGKIYYFDPKGKTFKKGSHAIVDTARGQEFGEVAMANAGVRTSDIVPPLRPIIRTATTADIEHHAANKQKEAEAFKLCVEKIAAHGLEMKLIDAQYTFDNSKLLFYFTSADRVDFRELVKDLASVFSTRIELRQIGIRDEAKIMGGLGMCGRPLCCTLFLSDFDQVSIKMAKEQNLSLNSAKISGICGRLMCCLKYEHEAYEYEIKRTPPVDSLVRTENGDGIVTEISPLRGTLKVRLINSPDTPPKTYHRDNITMLRKKQNTEKK